VRNEDAAKNQSRPHTKNRSQDEGGQNPFLMDPDSIYLLLEQLFTVQ
jgi:hypothetical protein